VPEEHRGVLARARAIYRGEAEELWEDDVRPQVRAHVDYVVSEIERAYDPATVERGYISAASTTAAPAESAETSNSSDAR
jgi:hypothetical protein